jgi:hypothetical protein
LLGQTMVFKANSGVEPQFYEVFSYDRTSNSNTLQHPVTKENLRLSAFPSDLYIGEACRDIGDPILDMLHGVGASIAPYMIRRNSRTYRASPPISPDRGFNEPRREPPASSPPAFAVAPRPVALSAAMSPATLVSSPPAGPSGPPFFPPGVPPSRSSLFPPGYGPPPAWGSLGHLAPMMPFPGASFRGYPPHPPLPSGPPPSAPVDPSVVATSWDPALADLRHMVEQLQSETREIRSGSTTGRSSLSAYAVGFMQKLHGGISAQESLGLYSQMSMGLDIALAPKSWSPILLSGLLCNTDIKHIDMKLSSIAEGVFMETFGYCEAEEEGLTMEQLRSLEQKVINLHRQERTKAIALVAKYP